MSKPVVVATRRSLLALTQTRAFVEKLRASHPGLGVEELLVTTSGDLIQDRPLYEVGGKGLFVKEIELALVDGRADIAVHSMKDVPEELAPGLILGCVPPREDPRDALIARGGLGLTELSLGAKIGSSSLRRCTQLQALGRNFEMVPLRGNVDTRIRKCLEGQVDAVVLAMAGLSRLGWLDRVTEPISIEHCLPAVGQGALAIECRADDARVLSLLAAVSDVEATLRVTAERGVQRAIGGGCQVPLAAYAEHLGENLRLRALLADNVGRIWRRERTIAWPTDEEAASDVGVQLGRELLDATTKGV